MTYIEFAQLDNLSLIERLNSEYTYEVPDNVESIVGMKQAAAVLRNVTNAASFITSVLSYVMVSKRIYKDRMDKAVKNGPEYIGYKQLYEMLVDKEKVIANHLEAMNAVKTTTSRMVTIKQEINKELMMTDAAV